MSMHEYKKPPEPDKYIEFVVSTGSHFQHELPFEDKLIVFMWGFENHPDYAVITVWKGSTLESISSNIPLKAKESETIPGYLKYYFFNSDI